MSVLKELGVVHEKQGERIDVELWLPSDWDAENIAGKVRALCGMRKNRVFVKATNNPLSHNSYVHFSNDYSGPDIAKFMTSLEEILEEARDETVNKNRYVMPQESVFPEGMMEELEEYTDANWRKTVVDKKRMKIKLKLHPYYFIQTMDNRKQLVEQYQQLHPDSDEKRMRHLASSIDVVLKNVFPRNRLTTEIEIVSTKPNQDDPNYANFFEIAFDSETVYEGWEMDQIVNCVNDLILAVFGLEFWREAK